MMTFAESLQFLRDLQWFGARMGLETTRELARHFGHPEDRLRLIHVAGTNGKGSTCAMLESVYRHTGLRVGLYTSPHLVRFSERIQINRNPVSEGDVSRLASELKLALDHLAIKPTFFEAVTIMALRYFAAQACDLVILETGLGGRLDATNIVTPLASVITNVQLDHQAWLGNTLEQIAFEKAGIIKPFRPLISGIEPGVALDTVLKVAVERGAMVTLSRHPGPYSTKWAGLELPLLGDHQWQNATTALATVQELQPVIQVSDSAIEAGLRGVRWPGRFQVLERKDGKRIVLDGAHNPSGMESLRAGLEHIFPGRRIRLILGAMRDKDWRGMCRIIAPLSGSVLVVPTGSDRGAETGMLEKACREANPRATVSHRQSLAEALEMPGAEEITVITGSLHLIGEATELLLPAGMQEHDERALNEWMTTEQLKATAR